MADHTSHARVEVDVNDRDALAKLNAIRHEFHRTMQDIDHEQATATIDADIRPFKRAVDDAKAEVKRLEGIKAEIEMGVRDGDEEALAAEILAAKKEVKSLDGMKAEIEIETRGGKEAIAEIEAARKAYQKRMDAINKQDRDLEKLQEQTFKRNLQRVKQESRVRESLNNQRLRELTTAEREAHQIERERSEVPKLEAAYSRLATKMENLGKARRRARGDGQSLFNIGQAENATMAEMNRIKSEVQRRVGRDPVTFDLIPSFSERAGRNARETFVKHFLTKGTFGTAALATGGELGKNIGDAAVKSFKRTSERGFRNAGRDIARSVGRSVSGAGMNVMGKIGHGLENLSEMTVRLGPISTSIKGLVVGLSILGPIIVDIVGALGALVSIAGAAALGVGALGIGIAGGAVPALLGMGLVIKGVVGNLQNVQKAQTAYNTAVLKYGEHSKQAKTAMKQMQSVMGGVSQATAKTFGHWQDLQKEFHKATAPARASVFTAMADGIKTASSLMPIFAHRTNQAMDVAQKGVSGWMKGLRSAAGKSALNEMMGNFNKSLGPVMHGLGQLGAYLGRIGQIASRSLPGLAKEFDHWAKSINSVDTHTLTGQVKGLIQNAKDVGRFFMAAGRLLKTFFAGGVDAGDSMVNTMTNAMNRWNDFLQTTKGQNSLQDFFKQGVAGAQALFSLLAPIVGSFVRWAEVLAPVSRAFFKISGDISSFAAKVLSLTALRGPLTGIVTTLGLLWGVGKIATATQAVAAFTRALLGMAGAEKAVAEGGALMKGASVIGGLGRGAKVAKGAQVGEQLAMDVAGASAATSGAKAAGAARGFGLLETAVAGVGTAFGITSSAGAVLATGGLALVAGAAAYGAYKLITMKSASDKFNDSIHNSDKRTQEYGKVTHSLLGVMNAAGAEMKNYRDSVGRVASIKKELSKLEQHGGKDTAAYKQKLSELNQALGDRETHYKNTRALFKESSQLQQAATKLDGDRIEAMSRLSQAQEKRATDEENLRKQGFRGKALAEQLKADDEAVAKAEANVAAKTREHAAAQRRAELGQLNYNRGLKGLVPLAGRAATALVNLAKRAPNMAQTISLKYADPKDAGAVASRANAALKSGISSKMVLKIIADSKNAEDAIRRLNNAKLTSKKLSIVEHGGKEAIAMVQRISGKKLTTKQQNIISKGGPAAIAMLGRILGIRIPAKTSVVNAKDNASGKIHGILGLIAALPTSKTTTITTVHLNKTISQHRSQGPGNAHGRRPGQRQANTKLIGEGGAPEYVVDNKTGTGFKTPGPMFYNLNPNQYVIPTEPKHKARGSKFFKEIANDLGIQGFAVGTRAKKHKARKPTHISHPSHKSKLPLDETGRAGERRAAASTIKKKTVPNKSALPEIDAYKGRLRDESDQNDAIDLAEKRLKEPDTFIKVVGTDDQGNEIYDIDQGAIDNWVKQLNGVAKLYDQLLTIMRDLKVKAKDAMDAIATATGTSTANLHKLQKLSRHEQNIIDSKHASTSERGAARERKKSYDAEIRRQTKIRSDAESDHDSIAEDWRHGIDQRTADYQIDHDKYIDDAKLVQGDAVTSADAANPKPQKAEPVDPFDAVNTVLGGLDAESALAAIGQGINGGPPRSQDAINADRVSTDQSIINIAKGLLADADPSNDAAAYSAMTSAANDIASLSNPSGGGGTTDPSTSTPMAAQYQSLGTARQDLYTSMGSNFSLAGSFGNATAALAPRYAFGPTGAQQSPGAANANGIVFNQTFQQMPDPHTWSQGVKFELQAAL